MHKILLILTAVLSAVSMQAAPAVRLPQDTLVVDTRPRYKSQGYRIQLYSGSQGRASKIEAFRRGEVSRSFFPELSVYCHFKSPRWVCRVGDFPTIEAARKYLKLMRSTTQFPDCQIVKSQVLLPVTFNSKQEND